MSKKTVLFYNKSGKVKYSSSGGAFFTIAEYLMSYENAIVYGATFDDLDRTVKHTRVSDKQELYKLQGSKYVQSYIGNTLINAKEDLDKGNIVLFSGTGCQIKGLLSYLGKQYENLYTVEIVCHGVPSKKYLDKCINYYEKKYCGEFKSLRFRNKTIGNRHGYIMSFLINKRRHMVFPDEDPYYYSFMNSLSLRPSCYECKYQSEIRTGDIILGDTNTQSFHPYDGVSLVALNNEKAIRLFNRIIDIDGIEIKDTSIYEEGKTNKQLLNHTVKPDGRDLFYVNVYDRDYLADEHESSISHYVAVVKAFVPTRIKQLFKGR